MIPSVDLLCLFLLPCNILLITGVPLGPVRAVCTGTCLTCAVSASKCSNVPHIHRERYSGFGASSLSH